MYSRSCRRRHTHQCHSGDTLHVHGSVRTQTHTCIRLETTSTIETRAPYLSRLHHRTNRTWAPGSSRHAFRCTVMTAPSEREPRERNGTSKRARAVASRIRTRMHGLVPPMQSALLRQPTPHMVVQLPAKQNVHWLVMSAWQSESVWHGDRHVTASIFTHTRSQSHNDDRQTNATRLEAAHAESNSYSNRYHRSFRT